jgi:hypothetical protein
MRLTAAHKQAFVNAILNDTPTVDYDDLARKLVQEYLVSVAPPPIRAIYESPELRPYLEIRRDVIGHMWGGYYCRPPGELRLPKHIEDKLTNLRDRRDEQQRRNQELRDKLTALIAPVFTRAKAVELMPELEKYLPPEESKTTNLPVVSGTIAALIEAGWPKDQQEA